VQLAAAGLRRAGIDPIIHHYAFCTNGSATAGHLGIPQRSGSGLALPILRTGSMSGSRWLSWSRRRGLLSALLA
jgi:hypothetical protein